MPDEFFLTAILGFILIPFLGIACGALGNYFSRKRYVNFKENIGLKFASSTLFGFILIFMDPFFWIGNITTISYVLIFQSIISLKRMFATATLWYLFIYFTTRVGFDHFFGKSPSMPYLKIEDRIFEKGYSKVFKELEVNLNAPFGKLRHRWAMPASKYMAAYEWDTAFISLVWKYWIKDLAGEILLPLLDNQFENGQVPHFAGWIHKSNKTQPPLIAWAISNLDMDIDYLKNVYQSLKKYNEWLYSDRRLENGLFFWQHSYESGIDNSPRFTDRSEKEKYDLTNRAVIDLNTYMVLQNQALIEIAQKLEAKTNEDYESDISEFQKKKEELIQLIQEYLWDEEAGLYFDYDISTKNRIEINTIASFFPLIAGIPSETQVERLVAHLESDQEYNTLIPLPTVALNDPTFVKDTWRGPVWLNTAYLVVKGLEKYHKLQLSSEFAYRLAKGVYSTFYNKGKIYEFYDPERYDISELTRKKGNLFKLITLGNKPVKHFVGWTGLANTLFIESVVGYDIIEQSIVPCLPQEFKGQTIVLSFPAQSFELTIEYKDEHDINVILTDLSGQNPPIQKKCEIYQKTSLK